MPIQNCPLDSKRPTGEKMIRVNASGRPTIVTINGRFAGVRAVDGSLIRPPSY